MTIKYIMNILCKLYPDKINNTPFLYYYINVIRWATGPIYHWSYASQYLKTCKLVPGLVNTASLLMARHLTVIENEYGRQTTTSEFVRQHDNIDQDIKAEKIRRKRISRNFAIADVIFSAGIICVFGSLEYEYWYENVKTDLINILLVFFEPSFDLVIALILVASSLYLTRQLRSTTRKKQNQCLLVWHQINFFFLIVTMASKTMLYVDYVSPDKSELEEK